MTARALVVDDDSAVASILAALLHQAGIAATVAGSAEAALAVLATGKTFDVLLSDVRMPGMDGLTLLSQLTSRWPEMPVIMLTAHGTVSMAVAAMKDGAADFIMKPFERDELLFCVKKALARSRDEEPTSSSAVPYEGHSKPMRDALEVAKKAASSTATVLLRGESGVGKEVVARFVHEQSPRAKGPFVKVHCAALPDTLLESELFGYEKGAFSGATARKPGRVELAESGTLFLDEIGDITPAVQVKLLRLMQDKEYEPLGGTKTLKADVRFLSATHQPLEEMVAQKKFREDLYYRLNVVSITIPPLRERASDVDGLAKGFCAASAGANGKGQLTLTPETLELLRRQTWPGNVRQLQNFIERLVVLSPNATIDRAFAESQWAQLSPLSAQPASDRGPLQAQVAEREKQTIVEALRSAGGNRTRAAQLLGVSRRTLYNKLDEHDLSGD